MTPGLDSAAAVSGAVGAAVSTWPGLAALIFIYLAPHAITYVQGRRTKKLAAKAATDAGQTREQTENGHADAEYPNLREQLDAMHTDIRQAATRADEAAKVATNTQTALTDHVASDEAWKTSVEEDIARRRRPLLSWRY